MKFIEKMILKTDNDDYYNYLFNKIEQKYFNTILQGENNYELTEKEYNDLLRFADILSRASDSKHRQDSYKIVSYMNELYGEDNEFKTIAESILIKLGNFPAEKLINGNNQKVYIDIETRIDKAIKETYQITPDNNNTFTDKQYELFEKLKNSNHYSFSGPTSFGKSFIIEEFIKYIISERKGIDNIAILVPTRALIAQTRNQLKANINDTRYRIVEYPDIPNIYMNKKNKFIFIFTPERLVTYLGNNENPNIDYMFIDEAQKIISDKDTRSPLYYHAILLAQRKSVKLYFSSPNIPNTDIFLELFEKSQEEKTVINENPVNQNKFYIDLFENKFYAINHQNDFISIDSTIDFKDKTIEEKLNHIIKIIGNGNKNIIYCNSINDTVKTAINFAQKLPIRKNENINKVIKLIKETIYDEYYLIDCLERGVAFHFGKLPQNIREKVEELFINDEIDYLFCTSTLLEGVNLPAKNIFILSNSIAKSKFSKIDFSNLAGRAGRLKYELNGNVICIRHSTKNNSWQGIDVDRDLIRSSDITNVESKIITGKGNFYTNIGLAIENKKFTNKNATENQKKIWKHFGNLIVMHANENNSSMLIKGFLEDNKKAKKIISESEKNNKVPIYILEQSSEINPKYQNQILNMKENYIFPKEVTKENCKEVLETLYNCYNWKDEESKGDRPLVRNYKRLGFLKHLMYNWMHSKPLKLIISASIRFYSMRGMIYNKIGYPENFSNKNRDQINQVINDIMGTIDNDLRFKVKNYMSNYYLLMCEKYGKENAGEDWTNYIEYGTTNLRNIELQKIGIPLYLAKFLLENVKDGIEFKGDILVNIDKIQILSSINKEKNIDEYNEVKKIL